MKPVSPFLELEETSRVAVSFEGQPCIYRKVPTWPQRCWPQVSVCFGIRRLSGDPRAPFCMMGACFDCLVDIDGITRQACMIEVAEGLEIRQPRSPEADDATVVSGHHWRGPGRHGRRRASAEFGLSVTVLDEQMRAGGQIYRDVERVPHCARYSWSGLCRGHPACRRPGRDGIEHVAGAVVWSIEQDDGFRISYTQKGRGRQLLAKQVAFGHRCA